ncbi:MAG TPA: winged helix-turn-helix domain-containing protein [Candidatus Dormibacteraeota bacterium]
MVRSPSNISLKIEVWDSPVIELLLTIFAYEHPFNWDSLEAGKAGQQRIRQGMSPELRGLLAELGLTGSRVHAWTSVAAWTWQQRIREPAAAATALEAETDDTRRRMATVIRLWHRDLFAAQEPALRERLERAAEATRELARRLAPEELIETVTNGIVWRRRPEIEQAVLVPSVVTSPWSTHEHVGSGVLFTFPVAQPYDPMERVQRLSAVLSDRTRVAALRLLAERELTLQEMADELGVSKSTMHHHLAQLRAAGLLRVPLGTKSYSLRRQPLEELGSALNEFGREK